MKQPKTVDEYIDLVHQAVYEVDELMSIFGDDAEAYEGVIPLVAQLDAELRKIEEVWKWVLDSTAAQSAREDDR